MKYAHLENLPIVRAHTMSKNEKQQDWLLSAVEMKPEDSELLWKILDNYEKSLEQA